jgi:hypothetical protein
MKAFVLVVAAVIAQPSSVVISGSVMDAGTGAPVAGARVVLARSDGPITDSVAATADGAGRFTATVRPGRYLVTGERHGYLRGASSSPVTAAAGTAAAPVALTLTATGVVAGRVFTELGEPARRVVVWAESNGGVAAEVRTNDLGEYRLYGLSPGRYVISAEPSAGPRLQTASGRLALLGAAGADPLGVYFEPAPPCRPCGPVGVTGFRLSDLVRDGGFVDPRALAGERYPAVYYPGTIDSAAAQPLDVLAGAVVAGIDLELVAVR